MTFLFRFASTEERSNELTNSSKRGLPFVTENERQENFGRFYFIEKHDYKTKVKNESGMGDLNKALIISSDASFLLAHHR